MCELFTYICMYVCTNVLYMPAAFGKLNSLNILLQQQQQQKQNLLSEQLQTKCLQCCVFVCVDIPLYVCVRASVLQCCHVGFFLVKSDFYKFE